VFTFRCFRRKFAARRGVERDCPSRRVDGRPTPGTVGGIGALAAATVQGRMDIFFSPRRPRVSPGTPRHGASHRETRCLQFGHLETADAG
jgi:hypothetical protein